MRLMYSVVHVGKVAFLEVTFTIMNEKFINSYFFGMVKFLFEILQY